MTKEEKQLLLKDLCARLPYGVIAYASEINKNGIITDVNIPYNMVNLTVDRANGKYELVPLFDIKPYLRPMSSLTEEEKEKLCELCDMYEPYNDTNDYSYYGIKVVREFCVTDEKYIDTLNFRVIDWLLENHFDYRGLIEKGLALEAPEGMYKTE